MTSSVRLAGIFLTAAALGHRLVLWALGGFLSPIGWAFWLGWMGLGLAALRRGGTWEDLWEASATSHCRKKERDWAGRLRQRSAAPEGRG